MVAPFDVLDLVRAVSHLYTADATQPVGRVIAVTGAKGGVGASTIAHNLAWSIARSFDIATVIRPISTFPTGPRGSTSTRIRRRGSREAVFAPDRLDANLVDRLLSKCSEKLSDPGGSGGARPRL